MQEGGSMSEKEQVEAIRLLELWEKRISEIEQFLSEADMELLEKTRKFLKNDGQAPS
jgi:hypothetical protein